MAKIFFFLNYWALDPHYFTTQAGPQAHILFTIWVELHDPQLEVNSLPKKHFWKNTQLMSLLCSK